MNTHRSLRPLASLSSALMLTFGAHVAAEQLLGFAQPGLPGRWAVESFPVISRTSDGKTSVAANTVLAYFSETGFTGTQRDQLQFWAGAVPGYASTQGAVDSNAWGV